jgi:hypothetical protein
MGDLQSRHRFNAARMAALVGNGTGADGGRVDAAERARWRAQARVWLRADLLAFGKLLDDNFAQAREWVRETLTYWQQNPDLLGIRDPGALAKLSPDEREDCLALWSEVDAVLKRTEEKR